MTKQLIALVAFASFVFGQVHGDCRDYTYDDCTAPGPFEINGDFQNEETCQLVCDQIWNGQDGNPKCQFYRWNYKTKECGFFNYTMAEYTGSCDIVAGTPLPGLEICQKSTDECSKFSEGLCQFNDESILEEYELDFLKCELFCEVDPLCKYFVHKKNAMNRKPMQCQLRSSKDASCDLEIGPSTPTKDQACDDAAICNALGNHYQYIFGKCYYIEETPFSQADAKENCENRFGVHGNGLLFEPKDKNTNDKVIEFARNLIKSNYFSIGIKDFNSKNNWQYLSNNEKLSWTNWATGQPANDYNTLENCVRDGYTNKWHDVPCNSQYPSICEMKTFEY